jgi:hypothetical protein
MEVNVQHRKWIRVGDDGTPIEKSINARRHHLLYRPPPPDPKKNERLSFNA